MLKPKLLFALCAGILVMSLLAIPPLGSQETKREEDVPTFRLGSILYSTLLFPIKLTTCAGTQIGAAVAYVLTYQVPGDFDDGTHGTPIGEVANGACLPPWVVNYKQVEEDFGG